MARWLDRFRRSGRRPTSGAAGNEPAQLAAEVVRHYESGQYALAEQRASRLVELQRELVGERHSDYATALSNLGLLRQKQGNIEGAEGPLRESLRLRGEVLGEHHPLYAASLSHLAELLQARGELAFAEPLLRQSIDVLRAAQGERHPDYATALSSLAVLLHRRGDLEAAEPLLRKALALRAEILGENHPQFATSLNNLALVLQRRGERSEAETLLRRATDLRKATLGPDHPDHGASLSHLAKLLVERGAVGEAIPLLEETIRIRSSTLGDASPEVRSDRRLLQTLRGSQAPHATPAAPAAIPPPPPTVAQPANDVQRPASSQVVPEPVCAPAPVETTSEVNDLHQAFSALERQCDTLREMMQRAGDSLLRQGQLPAHDVSEAVLACRAQFEVVRNAVQTRLREANGLNGRWSAPAQDLAELRARLSELQRLEEEQARRRAAHHEALERLNAVQTLVARNQAVQPLLGQTLEACHSQRQQLAQRRPAEPLSVDCQRLVDGSKALLSLVAEPDSGATLSDEQWLALYREVSSVFGKPVAAAAVRRRFRRSGAPA